MMPEINGYEVCNRLKTSEKTKDIAVMFLTALQDPANKTRGFELGAVDYITKPFNAREAQARVETHLSLRSMSEELSNQNIKLKQKVDEKTKQINETLKSVIQVMAQMVESRDPYIAGHQQRVSGLACVIAEKMELSSEAVETIRIAGVLHDIGKIRIPIDDVHRVQAILEFDRVERVVDLGNRWR